jgi:hypothetical protein
VGASSSSPRGASEDLSHPPGISPSQKQKSKASFRRNRTSRTRQVQAQGSSLASPSSVRPASDSSCSSKNNQPTVPSLTRRPRRGGGQEPRHPPSLPAALLKRVNLVKKRTLKGLPIDTVKSQERYELRWVQWLADWKIIPIDYDEDEMRIVLLGYADFVHTGGFCKGPLRNQETVKVANVDLHLRAAALRLQALGFDDIRYINRSTRSNAQPKYYVELQRLRVEIERHEAPTQSAVPLDQNLFARIYEAAKLVKKNPKKRLALLLICVSFSFMLRSQNLVKTNKGFNKRIRLEDVVLTDQSNTYLLKGKFSSLPLANTRLATLMIKHQKNNTKNEPRTRAGALFLSPLLTLLEDLKNNKAEGSRCLSDFKVGHTWSSITNSYLSDCLRDFAKGEGLELRVGRKISSHSCRASGAALLLQLGYDPAAIMLLGNWKSLNGLRSYLESQSAAFLEEINEKATKAKPSQNMRVQYPSNFNELSSKAVETQKQESSPSVPSPSASLPHPPKFEGANNPPNANLLNSRRRSLEYSSITDSTSSEEEGEQEENQFEDAEEFERMGEKKF